jgi:hypothetical protein
MFNERVLGRRELCLASLVAVIAAFAVMVVATGKADAGTGITSYKYTSEPGDYIGAGEHNSYTAADSSISIQGTSAYLTVAIERGGESWFVDLAAPRGETLHPGRYYDVERAVFRTGRAPGLDVSGHGRGCNEVWGSFSIRQISTDSAGRVTMLEATFVQNCESPLAPALKGTVKFHARPLAYAFKSDPGDFIGAGVSKSYYGDTSTFSLAGGKTTLRYNVSGQRDDWEADIKAPTGKILRPGSYNTTRFGGTGAAGLDVSGDGRGCNTSTGTLTINRITFDAAGKVTTRNASFVQHCEGAAPALRGTIRYYA